MSTVSPSTRNLRSGTASGVRLRGATSGSPGPSRGRRRRDKCGCRRIAARGCGNGRGGPTCWSRWTRTPSTRCGSSPSGTGTPTPPTASSRRCGRWRVDANDARPSHCGRCGGPCPPPPRWLSAAPGAGASRPGRMRYARRPVSGSCASASWLGCGVMALTAPGIPDRFRSRLGVRVHISLVRAGRSGPRPTDLGRDRQADERPADAGRHALPAGQRRARRGSSAPAPARSIEALLDVADAFVTKRDALRSAAALSKAMMLAAHRVLHFDRLSSPLAEDPEELPRAVPPQPGRPGPRGAPRAGPSRSARTPRDRPLRLLLATLINDNFLTEIRQRYENMPGVEVRFLDLNESSGYQWLNQSGRSPSSSTLWAGHRPSPVRLDDRIRPHLEWADTLFIDWCLSPAAMFTVNDPGHDPDHRAAAQHGGVQSVAAPRRLFPRGRRRVRLGAPARPVAVVLPQLTGPQRPTAAGHQQRHGPPAIPPSQARMRPVQPGDGRHQFGGEGRPVGARCASAGTPTGSALPAAAHRTATSTRGRVRPLASTIASFDATTPNSSRRVPCSGWARRATSPRPLRERRRDPQHVGAGELPLRPRRGGRQWRRPGRAGLALLRPPAAQRPYAVSARLGGGDPRGGRQADPGRHRHRGRLARGGRRRAGTPSTPGTGRSPSACSTRCCWVPRSDPNVGG